MSDFTRRDFVRSLAGAGALAAGQGIWSPRVAALQAQGLPTREIPGTGERLPIIGFGSSKAVLEIPDEGAQPIADVLQVLLEHGGRVIDTSPRTPEIDAEFAASPYSVSLATPPMMMSLPLSPSIRSMPPSVSAVSVENTASSSDTPVDTS